LGSKSRYFAARFIASQKVGYFTPAFHQMPNK